MRIERRNTTAGQSPYAGIDFRLTTSEIRNPDGSVVFRAENVEVPTFWSQVASDVLAQKYFRKARVAGHRGDGEHPREGALRQRDIRKAGVRPPRRLLDLLGLEGQVLLVRRR